MDELPDELLVMICQYALCPGKGLWLIDEPSSGNEKCNVRCQYASRIAIGLIFTNRRLSRIGLPILYGENTWCFSMPLATVLEFLESLPQANLERIKRIYFVDPNEPLLEPRIDDVQMDSAIAFFRHLSLDSFGIAVPRDIPMPKGRFNRYLSTNNGRLLYAVLAMLRDGLLHEVWIAKRYKANSHTERRPVNILGDVMIKTCVEPGLFDETTFEVLQLRRKSYSQWISNISPSDHVKEEVKKMRRTEYRNMLNTIKSIWESKGLTVKRRGIYLKTKRSAIVIRKIETPSKQE